MCETKKVVRQYLAAVEQGPRHKEAELLEQLKCLTCQDKDCAKGRPSTS